MWLNFGESVKVFYIGQKRILDAYSVWPQQTKWRILLHKINFWHVLCLWILLLDVLYCIHLGRIIHQMNELIRAIYVFATCSACTMKLISLKYNSVGYERLFGNLGSEKFCPKTAEETEIYLAARELTRKMFNYYGCLSFSALVSVLLLEFVIYKQMPVKIYNPFDETYGSFGYWLMFIYQCGALPRIGFLNISFDSLCCSMFIYVKAQLDILALRLQRIGNDSNEKQDNELDINLELKNCIEYHKQIQELAADIESLITSTVSTQIFCSVLVITTNFYALSLLSDQIFVFVKYFVYQSAMLIQVFILCYYAGEITQRSLELPHELYKADWVLWTRVNRKLLMMLMQRLDIGVHIRSIVPTHSFNLELFSSIVNCSYSYFALLKRVNS